MAFVATVRQSWLGERVAVLIDRIRELELLDRIYTLAAQTFVALVPLILVVAAALTPQGHETLVADGLIERLGLVGAGAVAMRELIVVTDRGVYWLGAVIVLYSAFSLSRRLGRTYNALWQTPQLRPAEQWRGLVYLLIQLIMIASVTGLRAVQTSFGWVAATLAGALILVVWFYGEFLIQRLFTRGAVERSRLLVAAGLTSVGRIGLMVWIAIFLAPSLTRQALSYGPIGVVFGLFTSLFASWAVVLGATLIAAVMTQPRGSEGPRPTSGSAVEASGL